MLKKLIDLKSSKLIILSLGVLLIIVVSYFIYTILIQNKKPINKPITLIDTNTAVVPITPPMYLINQNSDSISGTILNINKEEITIKLDDNTQQKFKLSPSLIIAPIPTPGQTLIISHDPSSIKVGSQVILTFELQDNVKVVSSVSYTKQK